MARITDVGVRRERFSVDQEGQRKYFPTGKSVEFTLLVAQRLFGVTFREAKVPTWHPDVRYFDVFDAKSGAFLSGFYLDLFPREGKFNHAAVFPLPVWAQARRSRPASAGGMASA